MGVMYHIERYSGVWVHVAIILVGRLFNGIGVGLMLVLVPLYQCEIAPAEVCGKMAASHGLLVVSGHAVKWIP